MRVERTYSTNTLLKEMLVKGEWPEGEEYLYAGFQTAGRGQTGNGWESEEGKNLLCSIVMSCQNSVLFDLNVAVSVAVHRTLSELAINELAIKWPNDIYWGDKKLAGILIENAIIGNEVKYTIAGIGLNVNQTEWKSDAPNPVSLKQITGKEYDINALMTTLMNKIHEVQTMRQEDIWEYYRRHLYRREGEWLFAEREVNLTPSRILTKQPKEAFKASIADITKQGELVLRTAQGEKKYHFKEILFVV